MATQTTNYGLNKDAVTDYYDINTANANLDIIDKALGNMAKFETAGGTSTAITLSGLILTNGHSKTFIVSADNNGAATRINGEPLYKPGTTTAPTLTVGKAVTVWYNGVNFFIKASAEGTAIAENVLAGKTFSNDDDTDIPGTMVDNGPGVAEAVNLTLQNQEYTIPVGKHSGLRKIKAVIAGLIASVIKAGTTVGGVDGTYTADATAGDADVLNTKTYYRNGVKGTGNMPNNGSVGTQNLTAEGAEYVIPAGYHNGLGKVKAVITGLIASVIKAGTTVGGILGTFTSDATATAGQMLSGVIAYVNGNKVTGTILSKGAATITPSTVNQSIAAGQYLSGIQTIAGDADLVATNILSGKNIFGVAGALVLGKKFASGVATSSAATVNFTDEAGSTYATASITISGLTFIPKVIFVYHNVSSNEYMTIYNGYEAIPFSNLAKVISDYGGVSGFSGTNAKVDTSPAYINITGFCLPCSPLLSTQFNWITFE